MNHAVYDTDIKIRRLKYLHDKNIDLNAIDNLNDRINLFDFMSEIERIIYSKFGLSSDFDSKKFIHGCYNIVDAVRLFPMCFKEIDVDASFDLDDHIIIDTMFANTLIPYPEEKYDYAVCAQYMVSVLYTDVPSDENIELIGISIRHVNDTNHTISIDGYTFSTNDIAKNKINSFFSYQKLLKAANIYLNGSDEPTGSFRFDISQHFFNSTYCQPTKELFDKSEYKDILEDFYYQYKFDTIIDNKESCSVRVTRIKDRTRNDLEYVIISPVINGEYCTDDISNLIYCIYVRHICDRTLLDKILRRPNTIRTYKL